MSAILLAAPAATYSIGRDHHATEEAVRRAGVPYAFLRNGWYNENYTGHLDAILEVGQVFGSAGSGRIAAAARADYAEAAAVILTGPVEPDAIYELSGDSAFTLADLADEISRQTGRLIASPDLTPAEYHAFMVGQGVDAADATQLVEADSAISRGELAHANGDLRRLLGRATTPIADSVAAALAAIGSVAR